MLQIRDCFDSQHKIRHASMKQVSYLAAGRVGRGLRFVGPIRQRGLKLKRGDNIVLGPLTFKQFKCTLYGGPSGGI